MVHCSVCVLQCVAVRCSALQCTTYSDTLQKDMGKQWCIVVYCVAVMQCIAACRSAIACPCLCAMRQCMQYTTTLQYTKRHSIVNLTEHLLHYATHCNTLQHCYMRVVYFTGGGDRTWHYCSCQNFKQIFTGLLANFNLIFTRAPKISNKKSHEYTESPSLQK